METAKKILNNERIYEYFNPCGLFVVAKEAILRRPKSFYENCLSVFDPNDKSDSVAYHFERLWESIFREEYKWPIKYKFLFSNKNHHIGTVHLLQNGTIENYSNFNEKFWIETDDYLEFLNGNNTTTTRFYKENFNVKTWSGDYFDGAVWIKDWHYLSAITASPS
jgi:hypothetical protein